MWLSKEAAILRQQVHPVWQNLEKSMFQEYQVPLEDVRHADVEYRRKRAIVWICSHAVAKGQSFIELLDVLKERFRISEDDFGTAVRNYRMMSRD